MPEAKIKKMRVVKAAKTKSSSPKRRKADFIISSTNKKIYRASQYIIDLNEIIKNPGRKNITAENNPDLSSKSFSANQAKKESLIKDTREEKINELLLANLAQLIFFILTSFFKPILFLLKKTIPSSFREKISYLIWGIKEVSRIKPQKGTWRAVAGFATIAIILTLPFQALTYYNDTQIKKEQILAIANEAFGQLKLGGEATSAFNLGQAENDFLKARAGFITAEQELGQINLVILSLIKNLPEKNTELVSGEALIIAGKNISEISQSLANLMAKISSDDLALNDKILLFKNTLDASINPKLKETVYLLDKVSIGALPADKQEIFGTVKGLLPTLEKSLEELSNLTAFSLQALGQNSTKRYLVIFQNNSELRPTGGFIGSFALIDVDRGNIKKIDLPAGGSYDLQGSLKEKVISPEPLHIINPHWQFQDANWFPDFPTSAEKIIWFYNKSGGPTVDGVIALDINVIQDLLKITGPIAMPEYKKSITADNFFPETQKIVEIDAKKGKAKNQDKPKQFLADLAPKLLDKFFNLPKDKTFDTISLFKNSLDKKDLLLYFTDRESEGLVRELGWAGEIKAITPGNNYLFVVNSNIAGGKTDTVIKQDIAHHETIDADGSIIDTVTITRTHEGKKGWLFTGEDNLDYLRVYAPLGSQLLEATGFEGIDPRRFASPAPEYKADTDLERIEGEKTIDANARVTINSEFGRTVFAGWMGLKAGESKNIVLRYRLPFKLEIKTLANSGEKTWLDNLGAKLGFKDAKSDLLSYALLVQKQPGARDSNFQSTIKLPSNLIAAFKYPANEIKENNDNELELQASLSEDKSFGFILKNK